MTERKSASLFYNFAGTGLNIKAGRRNSLTIESAERI